MTPNNHTVDLPRDKTLYVVGYSHLDTQWNWDYQRTISVYLPATMRDNFALLEEFPGYIFNFTGSRRYQMMEEYYPEDFARVKEWAAAGRWIVNGSSVDETDANVPAPESLVRNILYGNRYFERVFGRRPVDYMLPDCFGFPASMPTVLAHAGVRGFSTQKLTWGSAVPRPFNVGVWQGPDGTHVIAALNPGAYDADVTTNLATDDSWIERIEQLGRDAGVYTDYHYYGIGDEGGAPRRPAVEWVMKSLETDGPIKVHAGAADQLFLDLTDEQADRLPRYSGDLLLTEHSAASITSQCAIKRWNRRNELFADTAERFSALADWLGALPYPNRDLETAWHLILGSQMHDILPGTSIPRAYEWSWNDEAVAYAYLRHVIASAGGAITRCLDTAVAGTPLVVLNPLAVPRNDLVEARIDFPGPVRVYTKDDVEVPSQVIRGDGDGNRLLFEAPVPSCGAAVFDVRPAEAPSDIDTGLSVSERHLESPRYRAEFNDAGDLVRLLDKQLRRELLSGPARLVFLRSTPHEWPAWNLDWSDRQQPPVAHVEGPATFDIIENGPARVALRITRHALGSTFVQTYRLAANEAGDRLEVQNRIDWHSKKVTLKAEFPLTARNDKARYSWGVSTIERTTNDPRKYEVPSHQWIDLTDASGAFGVAILEDCKYGSDFPSPDTLRLTLVNTPQATVFTPQNWMDHGTHKVTYAIAGHEGDWSQGKINWRAARLNQAPVAIRAEPSKGRLGREISFLRCSSPQVMVKAVKKAEDGKALVVRLSEQYGRNSGPVEIALAAPVLAAHEVNGQEDRIGAATVQGGRLVVEMAPYQLRAFALELEAPAVEEAAPESDPLQLPFDMQATTHRGETGRGFDSDGHSYPAELFPGTLTSGGVEFRLGPPDGANALRCNGQSIALPAGPHRHVHLLLAATEDVRATFRAGHASHTCLVPHWSSFIHQWDNRTWEGFTCTGLVPGFLKDADVAWHLTHRHDRDGNDEPYVYTYLFRTVLGIPDGATELILPEDDRVRVFSATAVRHSPALNPLLTELEPFPIREIAPPTVEPASGSHDNTLRVRVTPNVYTGGAVLRHTTDGTEPTADSPVVPEPFFLSDARELRIRPFRGQTPAGPEARLPLEVRDTTPPAIESASQVDGLPLVRVRFNKPVGEETLLAPGALRAPGDATVRSVKSLEQGAAALIELADATTISKITAKGLRDRAPAANAMTEAAAAVTPIAPLITLMDAPTPDVEPLGPTTTEGDAIHFPEGPTGLRCPQARTIEKAEALTLMTWIKPAAWGGFWRVFQKGRQDEGLRIAKIHWRFWFHLPGVGEVESDVPKIGEWSHLAATWDGRELCLFSNGVCVSRAPGAGLPIPNNDPLLVGAKMEESQWQGDHFTGWMRGIRVYTEALWREEIEAILEATRPAGFGNKQ